MYHFFVDKSQIGENQIVITGSDVNHIKNVLRMKTGDKILISNRQDKDYYCIINKIDVYEIVADIESVDESGTELPAKIYLFQGLPKNDKMELIIQKAVELGVYEVIPVAMKRAIVKLDQKKEMSKLKRWSAISESAAKQSKRIIIPEIKNVMSFKEALAYAKDFDINIVPYENAKGMAGTKEIIDSIKKGMSVGVFIGPEGGFDDSEIEEALDAGAKPVTLGKRILRTETAGLTTLSILMYNLEE